MGKYYIGHLAYSGREYYGWQKQKDVPTVQETLFDTLRRLYPFGRIDVKATSRTDRGVHAFGQPVKFLIPRKEDPAEVLEKVNNELPHDLCFTQLERINKSFKVTYYSLFKEYLYFFSPQKEALPYSFVGHWDGPGDLDIPVIRERVNEFVGRHDFRYFQYRSDVKGDYVREILEANVFKACDMFPEFFGADEEVYIFHVKGKGFLKQMVRLMLGSLLRQGAGDLERDHLLKALTAPEDLETFPGYVAPPGGLFLYHVEFPELMVQDEPRRVVDHYQFKKMFPQFELWNKSGESSFPLEYRPLKD